MLKEFLGDEQKERVDYLKSNLRKQQRFLMALMVAMGVVGACKPVANPALLLAGFAFRKFL